MTGPMYYGHAVSEAHTDLDVMAQDVANASANASVALTNAATALAAASVVPQPALGRTATTLQQYLTNDQTLWAGDYGVIGDGVADDTAAMNYALAQAALAARTLYMGKMVVKITGPLTMTGPGLRWDAAGYGNVGDPGIYVTGSGYVALTVSGSPQEWVVSVYGTGNACQGILFSNIQSATMLHTRVYNLAGYGSRIVEEFDCWWGTESVELCGTPSAYAWSIVDGGGPSNMSHHIRVQVEQANTLAMSVGGNSLCIIIDAIHSERLRNPDNTKIAWSFDGAACAFTGGRFESSGTSANATLLMQGENCSYICFRAEGNIKVELAGSSGTGITVISPNFNGTAGEVPAQSGAIVILGGQINSWTGSTANRYLFGAGTLSGLLPLTGGTLSGNLKLGTAGNQLFIKQGSNASQGRASLSGGHVVVANTLSSTTMEVFLTYRGVSNVAHMGDLYVAAIVVGTSFEIKSTNVADDSDVSWWLVERA